MGVSGEDPESCGLWAQDPGALPSVGRARPPHTPPRLEGSCSSRGLQSGLCVCSFLPLLSGCRPSRLLPPRPPPSW